MNRQKRGKAVKQEEAASSSGFERLGDAILNGPRQVAVPNFILVHEGAGSPPEVQITMQYNGFNHAVEISLHTTGVRGYAGTLDSSVHMKLTLAKAAELKDKLAILITRAHAEISRQAHDETAAKRSGKKS